MANKYDLELALDTYRAQNWKESEIGLFEDSIGLQYGSQRFSNREQAVYWLKQQKPNHEAIKKMIAEEHKNYPQSGLNPLFEMYEKYYQQVQAVQKQTEIKLWIEKPHTVIKQEVSKTPISVPPIVEKVNTPIPATSQPIASVTPVAELTPSISTISGPTRRIDGLPEPTRRPIEPDIAKKTEVPETSLAPIKSLQLETTSNEIKKLDEAMANFRSTIREVSDKSWKIYDTPEEIELYKSRVNESLKNVLPILNSIEWKKLSKDDKILYEKTVLEIAKYFDNTLEGIKNRHYRNYDLAFDLALSLIKNDLKKYTIPQRPSQKDVIKSLNNLDPKLQQKIQNDMRAGYDLGQILSNPQVRSQWDEVYRKIYGKYEESMQLLLKSLKDKRPTLASVEWQKALDTMISIMGTKDFFDLKARNRDLAAQTGGMIASTIGGVWAVAVSPLTLGASGIVGAALLGWVITTAGMIATKGRWGINRETGTELGINVATLGLAGGIAKWANIMMKSGTMIARTAGITVDAVGGIGLGMGADYVRAWEADTSITLSDSFKNNWYWALLPIAMGTKGMLRNEAEKVQGDMNRAAHQAQNGDIIGANATIAQAEQKAAEIAQAVKAQQVVAQPINTAPPAPIIHSPLPTPSTSSAPSTPSASVLQNTASHTTPQNTTPPPPTHSTTTPHVGTAPANTVTSIPAQSVATSDISNWIESSIPKKAKIGEELKFGNVTIIPKDGWKYDMKHNSSPTQNFDNKKELASGINKAITDPKERIKLLESTSIKHVDAHLKWLHESIVPGTNPPVRIIREGEGAMAVEVQDPLTKWWAKKNPEALSEGDLTLLIAHYTGKNPVQIRESWLKAAKAKLSDHVSPADEKYIIEKHGSKFWKKFKAEFAGAGHASMSFKDNLIGMIPIPGIGVSKMSWKSALIFTSIVEFLEYIFSQDPVQKNYDIKTADGIKNIAGAAFQVLAYKYMWGLIGTVVPILVWNKVYTYGADAYQKVREHNR